MHTLTASRPNTHTPRPMPASTTAARFDDIAPARRERELGVGYGRSSGYASGHRSYSPMAATPGLFQVR